MIKGDIKCRGGPDHFAGIGIMVPFLPGSSGDGGREDAASSGLVRKQRDNCALLEYCFGVREIGEDARRSAIIAGAEGLLAGGTGHESPPHPSPLPASSGSATVSFPHTTEGIINMDERIAAQAAFGLRLSADLLTTLVVTGALPKKDATALVSDALNALLDAEPDDLAPLHRETAATLTAQVEIADAMFRQRLGE